MQWFYFIMWCMNRLRLPQQTQTQAVSRWWRVVSGTWHRSSIHRGMLALQGEWIWKKKKERKALLVLVGSYVFFSLSLYWWNIIILVLCVVFFVSMLQTFVHCRGDFSRVSFKGHWNCCRVGPNAWDEGYRTFLFKLLFPFLFTEKIISTSTFLN